MLLINGTNTKCYKRSAVKVGVVGTSEEICKLKVQSEYTTIYKVPTEVTFQTQGPIWGIHKSLGPFNEVHKNLRSFQWIPQKLRSLQWRPQNLRSLQWRPCINPMSNTQCPIKPEVPSMETINPMSNKRKSQKLEVSSMENINPKLNQKRFSRFHQSWHKPHCKLIDRSTYCAYTHTYSLIQFIWVHMEYW